MSHDGAPCPAGLRVLPQVYIERIGRADLVDVGRRILHRYPAMTRTGRLVARFTYRLVMDQPTYVHDTLVAPVRLRERF